MRLLLFSLISLYFLVGFIPNKANANDFDLTIITTDGGDLDILQDGEDNNIDIDVDGRTSNGSSITITQTGNNKNYNASLWCGHSYCTMTLNQ
tara:strand:- start:200 stop:478 length:279 start_codon:yes stop_codon:yes gene_type:complete